MIKKNKNKEAIILYSGGLDSSAVAGLYGFKGYNRLHLLTFDNGCQSNIDLSKVKLFSIKDRFPDTQYIHKILSSKYPFKKIAIETLEEDFKDYSTNLVCVGCKMSMHTESVLYAIENNIGEVVDGFAKRQKEYPEQDKVFIEYMQRFYSKYNLIYSSPLYERVKTKNDVKDILIRFNLSTKSIEPDCLFGDSFSPASKKDIRKYFTVKKPMLDKYIEESLQEMGLEE